MVSCCLSADSDEDTSPLTYTYTAEYKEDRAALFVREISPIRLQCCLWQYDFWFTLTRLPIYCLSDTLGLAWWMFWCWPSCCCFLLGSPFCSNGCLEYCCLLPGHCFQTREAHTYYGNFFWYPELLCAKRTEIIIYNKTERIQRCRCCDPPAYQLDYFHPCWCLGLVTRYSHSDVRVARKSYWTQNCITYREIHLFHRKVRDEYPQQPSLRTESLCLDPYYDRRYAIRTGRTNLSCLTDIFPYPQSDHQEIHFKLTGEYRGKPCFPQYEKMKFALFAARVSYSAVRTRQPLSLSGRVFGEVTMAARTQSENAGNPALLVFGNPDLVRAIGTAL